MATEPMSVEARMQVHESRLDTLTDDIRSLTSAVRQWIDESHKQPRAIPFKEIIITFGATLSVFYGIMTFLDNQADHKFGEYRERLGQVERTLAAITTTTVLISGAAKQ